MRTTTATRLWAGPILLAALACWACRHQTIGIDDTGTDTDTDSDTDTDADTDTHPDYPATGVDILIVVDNSGSMQEEQWILADHVYDLAEGLAAAIDSVRVAVVSSDMGLSWGGNPYENGDGWPGDTPQGCGSVGDNGEFQTYSSGKTITLDDEVFECPGFAATWTETPIGDPPQPNPDLAGQVACLTSLGTLGCGWEQQLQAAAVAVEREDQAAFHHEDHLLAVIVVSDEDDCSIQSNGLFAEDEIQNLANGMVNIACGNHPQHLYGPKGFADTYAAPKGGNPNALLFAAIVGVPAGDGDELSACEGRGHEIESCLNHVDMELTVVQENDAYFFKPACERYEATELVTKARPGRRFVGLAEEKQENAFVYSICRADWTGAMDGIAQMIDDELAD
jgi:hypothetical protein